MKTEPTYQIRICLSGPLAVAEQIIREEVAKRPLCVTIRPQKYIYTGGEEEGYEVGLLNYPRFPSTPEELDSRAHSLAMLLLSGTFQRSALVVTPEKTSWITLDTVPPMQQYSSQP